MKTVPSFARAGRKTTVVMELHHREPSKSLARFVSRGVPIHPSVAALIVRQRDTVREYAPQGSDAWLKQRSTRLTASDLAAALGHNKYKTRGALARDKAGFGEPFEGNAATRHGQLYEPYALSRYEEKTKEKVLDFPLILDPVDPRLGGSPDGVTLSGKLLEIKVRFILQLLLPLPPPIYA